MVEEKVLQGSNLGCLLFIIYINTLLTSNLTLKLTHVTSYYFVFQYK